METTKQPKTIKLFQPIKCPYCEKEYYVGIQSTMSEVISTPTIDGIGRAKEMIRERLGEIDFYTEEDKQEIITYLNYEETIVDLSDVEKMLRQIALEQINKKQSK